MNTLIKFLLSTFALCCISLGVKAQRYEVGQHVTVDGHSAIVVYVDSTGEHGLFAGPALALYTKKKQTPKKFVEKFSGDKKKRDGLRYFEQGKLGVVLEAQLTDEEEDAFLKPALDSLISPKGDVNQRFVNDYCQKHSIDMATFFPDFAWAQFLGEGWFLGGIDEVNAYVNNIAQTRDVTMELNQKSINEGHTYFYPLNLVSSTCAEYMGQMCKLAQLWTYTFRFYKVQEYQYVVAAKKTMPVWVEKKEVQFARYEKWNIGMSLGRAFLYSSRERSDYYDREFSWKTYRYRLAFKRF